MGDELVGLVVDSVSEVLHIPTGAIDPPPQSITGINTGFLDGIGKLGDHILILLNLDELMTSEEELQLQDLQITVDNIDRAEEPA